MDHINNCLLSGLKLPYSPPPAATAAVTGPLGVQPLPAPTIGQPKRAEDKLVSLTFLGPSSRTLPLLDLAVNDSFTLFNENQAPHRSMAQRGSRALSWKRGLKDRVHLWSSARSPTYKRQRQGVKGATLGGVHWCFLPT